MLNETFYEWLDKKGYADRITEQTETIDTVEHATQQIGCNWLVWCVQRLGKRKLKIFFERCH